MVACGTRLCSSRKVITTGANTSILSAATRQTSTSSPSVISTSIGCPEAPFVCRAQLQMMNGVMLVRVAIQHLCTLSCFDTTRAQYEQWGVVLPWVVLLVIVISYLQTWRKFDCVTFEESSARLKLVLSSVSVTVTAIKVNRVMFSNGNGATVLGGAAEDTANSKRNINDSVN